MSEESERVYTINLGKVLLSQSQHRAVRAINMIREFARHHMKVEKIKIDEDLAQLIWARGVRRPPRKIRVRMNPTDEGHILVSAYDEDLETRLSADKQDSTDEGHILVSAYDEDLETRLSADKQDSKELPEPASETPAAETVSEPQAAPEPVGTESSDMADSADKPKTQDTSDQKS